MVGRRTLSKSNIGPLQLPSNLFPLPLSPALHRRLDNARSIVLEDEVFHIPFDHIAKLLNELIAFALHYVFSPDLLPDSLPPCHDVGMGLSGTARGDQGFLCGVRFAGLVGVHCSEGC